MTMPDLETVRLLESLAAFLEREVAELRGELLPQETDTALETRFNRLQAEIKGLEGAVARVRAASSPG